MKKQKLILYYSGSTNGESLPEQALKEKNDGKGADIMLTFYEIINVRGDTKSRMFRHIKKRKEKYDADRQRDATKTTGDRRSGNEHKRHH